MKCKAAGTHTRHWRSEGQTVNLSHSTLFTFTAFNNVFSWQKTVRYSRQSLMKEKKNFSTNNNDNNKWCPL